MPNNRISKERRALVLAALCKGASLNAASQMFRVGDHNIRRVIKETGDALLDYMDANFRDLPCLRIELDEQWQYVGCHQSRMPKRKHLWERKDAFRGDFWLWAAIDPDTKLIFSHKIGKRDWWTGETFVQDVAARVKGPVQIATDNWPPYVKHIQGAFHGYTYFSYGTETKIFGEPHMLDGSLARWDRNEGVRKLTTAERKAVFGSPDLESLTTSHIERAFLTVRQELKRYSRKTIAYSKDLGMHKAAVALHFGIYNFVRRHKTIGTTPAVAAGIELEPWSLEDVVEITDQYLRRTEDAEFEKAFAAAGI